MAMIVVITGTPGVGKSTIAASLSKRIPNSVFYDINDLIKRRRLYSGRDKFGTRVVKLRDLQREIENLLRSGRGKTVILDGHILCELKIRGAIAVVLREHIQTVKRRLLARGYPEEKIRENLVCEATDYCGATSQENYRKVYEVMSGRRAVPKILALIRHKDQLRSTGQIDLLEELVPIIKKEKRFALRVRSLNMKHR